MENPSAEKALHVSLLGGICFQMGNVQITDENNRSLKLWNVLCYLLVHRDRSVPQAELIDQFWPGEGGSNPASALKTLLYRVRAMLEPLFSGGPEPILSQRGAYAWNPAIPCTVDADQFEELCRQAADSALSSRRRIALYQAAAALYRGSYLPKLCHQMWVAPLSARYHGRYIEVVKSCAALLEQGERFQEMEAICRRGCALEPLDEGLHILLLRALLRQGRNSEALNHYKKATDLLYRSLGVTPSEELKLLYRKIMAVEQSLETDLEVIQAQLQETAARPGAFVCEYGFFQEAYRLEARRARRSGDCVHLGLITVSPPEGEPLSLNMLNTTMDQFLAVLAGGLRRGDLVSRYSNAQYVVLLPSANFEDSERVLHRIVSAFYRQHHRNPLNISCRLRALEP